MGEGKREGWDERAWDMKRVEEEKEKEKEREGRERFPPRPLFLVSSDLWTGSIVCFILFDSQREEFTHPSSECDQKRQSRRF